MDSFFTQIFELVRQIPEGRVSTYGQIALLSGNPRAARAVGYALHHAPDGIPCHRIVNRNGGLSDAFLPSGKETHRFLLELEGIPFDASGNVKMDTVMWYGKEE